MTTIAEDIAALKTALGDYMQSVRIEHGVTQLQVPYELYRAALEEWQIACSADRISRLLDSHAKALELLKRGNLFVDDSDTELEIHTFLREAQGE